VITDFHFMRPMWLLTLLPLLILGWCLFRQTSVMTTWNNVCDSHLLPYLIKTKSYGRRTFSQLLLSTSLLLMIIGLAGPTWSLLPVPTYQQIHPRVVVLDMSDTMLANDLRPNRLSRAKFKLHDLFQHKDAGQFGLVVYTGEPFVVSPLTEDGQTIDALLSSLTPDVMPVEGQMLSSALDQASQLIAQAGFQHGQLLVLTASSPSREAIGEAKALAKAGIDTSIMPTVSADTSLNPLFQEFATAGHGKLIPFSDTSTDLEHWLATTQGSQQYTANSQNDIPVWRDEGRWFLLPALFFLLPAFRRGWIS
jgi:Ca-activated chloride channel family protein